ncbi:MAG TPA: bifunctional tetrahydrofolate synthase/dihydrofolate synthase [Pseudomonas xinjiangensis]|uniref:Dihydrofolate synthase/folylpolyglutamate synthase n=2 Tax=root TaxID=1 RepID=A0A7V1FT20_9GAMM|nr:bifunctional tetrahydrofolate synthase/dihydrofolate synthase [Halopseudomonas xinjiangensis]HEC49380.1 bifunctional tetrahydrofolate synthase/dihydrofolate synthase [Halopseudomonas xinjiangensis]
MSPLSLPEWLARLESLHPVEIDMGLGRVQAVAERLQLLRPAPLVFTVTGTNGKGSTCAGLDSLLRQSGLRSGCYTSPHLLRYNERITLQGEPVGDQDLCQAFQAIEDSRGDISLTYFEFGTLAALWLFRRAGLDAVVLEVGLGGRLDAVNVVDATIAVVTSIGLDHQEYLGDTRESVGFEKAGIMRAGRPVVTGETDLPQTFVDEVARRGATLLQRDAHFGWSDTDDQCWSFHGLSPEGQPRKLTRMPSVRLPRDNLVLAVQAFWAAGLDLSDTLIAQALREAFVPGRLERRSISWRGQPRRLCLDVGHNPHAAAYLASYLRARPDTRQAVFGLLGDKDLAGVVDPLCGLFESWAVASLSTPRSRSAEELAVHLIARGERVEAHDSVAAALIDVLDNSPSSTEIVIFGSFFCVSEAILWLSAQVQELTDG